MGKVTPGQLSCHRYIELGKVRAHKLYPGPGSSPDNIGTSWTPDILHFENCVSGDFCQLECSAVISLVQDLYYCSTLITDHARL